MKKIIVPIDFSVASEKAIEYIVRVFKDSVELELIFVAPKFPEINLDQITSAYDEFEKRILKPGKLEYNFKIRRGQLLEEIQHAIHEHRPSFVVMGTSKSSLAKALVKLTDSPVIIVPESNKKLTLKRIGYANDFNDIKVSSALDPLLKLSRDAGATVHIIHVGQGEKVPSDKAEPVLEYYMDRVEHEYVYINSDDIIQAMQSYIKENKIDMLALLLRDHGSNDLHTKGALVEQLVSKIDIPLLSLI